MSKYETLMKCLPESKFKDALINEINQMVRRERNECAKICAEYAKESSHPMNFAGSCARKIKARAGK